jgi:hypothetical protein
MLSSVFFIHRENGSKELAKSASNYAVQLHAMSGACIGLLRVTSTESCFAALGMG